jgi:glycosyltransferase involved in cell wall biosynthesis
MAPEPTSPPRVSVLLPVKNGASDIELTLAWLRAQTVRDIEILVMNDGSEDTTPQILARLAAEDPRIRVFHHEKGQGITTSLNELIGHARAPFLAREDCGDYSFPHRFEKQLALLEAHPDAAAAVSDYWLLTEDDRTPIGVRTIPHTQEGIARELERHNPIAHGTIMMRSDILKRMGPYNPEARHSEDYDLLVRLSRNGGIVAVPEPLVAITLSPYGLSFRNLRTQIAYVNKLRHKHFGTPLPTRYDFPPLSRAQSEAAYHFHVGKMFLAKGQPREARRHLRQSIARSPWHAKRLAWTAMAHLPYGLVAGTRKLLTGRAPTKPPVLAYRFEEPPGVSWQRRAEE